MADVYRWLRRRLIVLAVVWKALMTGFLVAWTFAEVSWAEYVCWSLVPLGVVLAVFSGRVFPRGAQHD